MTGGASHKADYYLLFAAQGLALVGTGIATVGLALLAYRLAGEDSGAVVGTALAIRMLTYVSVAPIGALLAARLPRRPLLVALDLARALVVLLLPFVTKIWQIYLLIFLAQAASGVFTATYQALVPELLPGEADYTRALARSRLLHEAEGAVSPSLAALLLVAAGFHGLFVAAMVGFCVSAVLILRAHLPAAPAEPGIGPFVRLRRGLELFRSTRRLRGLAWLNLAIAAGNAMIAVNTVVMVQAGFGRDAGDAALALIVNGVGSAVGALLVPLLRERVPMRGLMRGGAALAGLGLLAASVVQHYGSFLTIWFAIGIGTSAAGTPIGAVLRRSCAPADRQAVYIAQFTLANASLLLAYPLAGWIGAVAEIKAGAAVLGVAAAVATLAASIAWPADGERADTTLAPLVEEEFAWTGSR